MTYKVSNINDLELLYSILREKHPKQKLIITFSYHTKEYTVVVSDEIFKKDPEVPVDFNIEVVYGDSVVGDTPLILRDTETKRVCIKTIDSVCYDFFNYPEFKILDNSVRLEKQFALTNYEVWCDQGWTHIKKVIRHKTNKKIYRVVTNTGVVDVTEDHSLCTPDLQKIKPTELTTGKELLHSFPTEFVENGFKDCDYILNASRETKLAYLEEYSNNSTFYIPYFSSKLAKQRLFYIMKSVGLSVGLDISGNIIEQNEINQPTVIKSITQIDDTNQNTFVYDLETECGRFNAGVGEMTVFNTDSVFLGFNYNRTDFKKNRIDTFKLAELCGEKLTMDVFSRLMMDRIIFLGVPIDDYVANIIQAQLLFLESSDSRRDIQIYLNIKDLKL